MSNHITMTKPSILLIIVQLGQTGWKYSNRLMMYYSKHFGREHVTEMSLLERTTFNDTGSRVVKDKQTWEIREQLKISAKINLS